MKMVVYCDESRHDGHGANPYMAIGGLWLPREDKPVLSKAFRRVCEECGFGSEIKWHKVSRLKLDAYKRLVDFFFDHQQLCFRVILVEQDKVDYARFHGSDRELGFYKFYYEMLNQWLTQGNEYLLLLDFKKNKGADRFTELRRVLENKIRGRAWISDLTVIDSHQSRLMQLADLLTGACAAAWCDNLPPDSAKRDLIRYIGEKRGRAVTVQSISCSVDQKFNVFNIHFRTPRER
ncbi:DUF3800 domain-containing protein [Verrucomicrobia bacterium S94]|nr:DUF3800 domain-containing protein [Verrucomicrobia bacterium S94]